MSSRTWIKIYVNQWLEGTISDETITIRGVWVSLLVLAGNSNYGENGQVKALNDVGFNDSQLASMLKINQRVWLHSKKRLVFTNRITVEKNNILTIINWQKYQSEYERTSKYRSNDTTNDTPKSTTKGTAIEYRGKSIDNRIENIYKSNNDSLPEWIKKETWDAFMEMRKKKRAAPTEKAKQLIIQELDKLRGDGFAPDDVLNQSIMRSYTGVFPLKAGNVTPDKKPIAWDGQPQVRIIE